MKQSQITRARTIARSLGPSVAARYLKKRGWSVEAAFWIIFRKAV